MPRQMLDCVMLIRLLAEQALDPLNWVALGDIWGWDIWDRWGIWECILCCLSYLLHAADTCMAMHTLHYQRSCQYTDYTISIRVNTQITPSAFMSIHRLHHQR